MICIAGACPGGSGEKVRWGWGTFRSVVVMLRLSIDLSVAPCNKEPIHVVGIVDGARVVTSNNGEVP